MEIEEAIQVFNKYYTKEEFGDMCKMKKFDGSETDTIKKHQFRAELLQKKAREVKDDDERKVLYQAADCYNNLYIIEFNNK